jgi:hypothetical protein
MRGLPTRGNPIFGGMTFRPDATVSPGGVIRDDHE